MNAKVSKLLTAIFFAVAGTIGFIYGIVLAVRSVIWYPIGAQFLIYYIIGGLIWLFAAVMIFIDKNKLFAVIALGTLLLGSFIGIFLNRAVLRNIFLFLAILMLSFYVLLYFKPELIKLPASLVRLFKKVFWFLPAVTFLLFAFIAWFVYRSSFLMILKDLLITGGLVFAGLWLASKLPDVLPEPTSGTTVSPGIGVPAAEHVISKAAPADESPEETWTCPTCGSTDNPGNFCMKCGTARPVAETVTEPEPEPEKPSLFNEDGTWNCPTCGSDHNPGNFCMKCGTAKPEPEVIEEVISEPEETVTETADEILPDTNELISEDVPEDIVPVAAAAAIAEEVTAEEPVVESTIEEIADSEEIISETKEIVAENISVSEDTDTWVCPSCGRTGNTGKFCGTCGTAKPEEQIHIPADDGTWICPNCGRTGNSGKFCGTCGTARP